MFEFRVDLLDGDVDAQNTQSDILKGVELGNDCCQQCIKTNI